VTADRRRTSIEITKVLKVDMNITTDIKQYKICACAGIYEFGIP